MIPHDRATNRFRDAQIRGVIPYRGRRLGFRQQELLKRTQRKRQQRGTLHSPEILRPHPMRLIDG